MASFQQEKSGWKLYILKCVEDHWYVGITSKTVEERFAEHENGSGAAATGQWKPIHVRRDQKWMDSKWISTQKDTSLPTHEQYASYQDRKDEAEELERIVTAQLMLLAGVNRVRGGGKDDLVHRKEYASDEDKKKIVQNISSSLCIDDKDELVALEKHVCDEIQGKRPPYFSRSDDLHVFIDFGYNVVVNGMCIRHGTPEPVKYDPLGAELQPKILKHPWTVLFREGYPVNEVAMSRDIELRTLAITFFLLALSSVIVSVMAFAKPMLKLQAAMTWLFLFISNAVMFALILSVTAFLLKRDFNPESDCAYWTTAAVLFLVTPVSSILGTVTIENIVLWAPAKGIRIPMGLATFQTTAAVFAAASAIGAYKVLVRTMYSRYVAAFIGLVFNAGVIVPFYFLAKPIGTISGNELADLNLPFTITSAIVAVICTMIIVYCSRIKQGQTRITEDQTENYLNFLYRASFCVPLGLVYMATTYILGVGVSALILVCGASADEYGSERRRRRY